MKLHPIIQSVALPIVLGCLSAVAVSRMLSKEPQETGSGTFVPVRTAHDSSGETPLVGDSVDDLARRIAALEAQNSSPRDGVNSDDTPDGPRVPAASEAVDFDPLGHEEAIEALRLHRDELEDSFQAERVDAAWGPNAQDSYAEVLADTSEEGEFTVEEIECRTTRCRAALRVDHPDRAAMDHAASTVLHGNYAHNCTTHVYEVPEELGGDPAQLFVQWDCAEERAAEL